MYNNGNPPHRYTPPYIGAILHKYKRIFSSLNGMVQVPQWNKYPPQIVAVTPYDVTLPPNDRLILLIQQPDCNTNQRLLLEPLYNKNNLGLRVARTVVWVNGRKYCPVWNETN